MKEELIPLAWKKNNWYIYETPHVSFLKLVFLDNVVRASSDKDPVGKQPVSNIMIEVL